MSNTDFTAMPDDSRLYIFGTSRAPTPAEAGRILAAVDEFVAIWKAHGAGVAAARDWRHDRFVLVAADEGITELSGCSIDTLVRQMKALEEATGIRFVDGDAIFYRDAAGSVVRAGRKEFGALVESGAVRPDTIVFDNTITQLAPLRRGGWEKRFADSWHARAFGRASTTA